jgi:hypothetical protein
MITPCQYGRDSAADHPEVQTTRDPLMVAYRQRVLNGLVYELYFPEEVHGVGLRLFDLVARPYCQKLQMFCIVSVTFAPFKGRFLDWIRFVALGLRDLRYAASLAMTRICLSWFVL